MKVVLVLFSILPYLASALIFAKSVRDEFRPPKLRQDRRAHWEADILLPLIIASLIPFTVMAGESKVNLDQVSAITGVVGVIFVLILWVLLTYGDYDSMLEPIGIGKLSSLDRVHGLIGVGLCYMVGLMLYQVYVIVG